MRALPVLLVSARVRRGACSVLKSWRDSLPGNGSRSDAQSRGRQQQQMPRSPMTRGGSKTQKGTPGTARGKRRRLRSSVKTRKRWPRRASEPRKR
ncbi:unnamed protein product [Amoebophrya sp. A25]|nr:unnamed protein product [Amoebophrya sp. A25]|eukprot:GSA25T00002086001.1